MATITIFEPKTMEINNLMLASYIAEILREREKKTSKKMDFENEDNIIEIQTLLKEKGFSSIEASIEEIKEAVTHIDENGKVPIPE
ncbi:MAG: hypothetical protein PHU42_02555 [Patescibacteria group bacterium]|nr:hypothetical protein [Patescibacteria group bacterium]